MVKMLRKRTLTRTTHDAEHLREKRRRLNIDATPVPDEQPHPQSYGYNEHDFTLQTSIGLTNKTCQHRQAPRFANKPTGFCCSRGKINVPLYPPQPAYLLSLLKDHIRAYNYAFQTTSFACSTRQQPGWNPTFTVQGQVFRNIGSIFPQPLPPISFLDNRVEEVNRRQSMAADILQRYEPNEATAARDIVIHQHDGTLKRISELHHAYDPLQYPLLFPYGTNGNNIYLTSHQWKKVTQMQYYSYDIMWRKSNHLLQGRHLVQQFIVDMYCKVETKRLRFLWLGDDLINLQDSLLTADCNPANLGQRLVLPATFTGSPRYKHQKQQDAITYVREYGRPDLFIMHQKQQDAITYVREYGRPDLFIMHQKQQDAITYVREYGRPYLFIMHQKQQDAITYVREYGRTDFFIMHQKQQDAITYVRECGRPDLFIMHQKQQDAITYVREHGRPDLFIITTMNPKWTKIIENLLPHQTALDRPDIVVRVFNQKLQKLVHLIKNGCFGNVQAWLFSVDFKNMLIWLALQSKVIP